MSLYQTLTADLTAAMKARDAEKLGVLRMIRAALLNMEKGGGADGELADDVVLSVLQKEAKKRKEAIDAFEKGGRADLADQEKMELGVIEAYLPAEFTDEEIRAIITETVGSLSSDGAPQFGAAMGPVMAAIAGRADGNRVRAILQEVLGA